MIDVFISYALVKTMILHTLGNIWVKVRIRSREKFRKGDLTSNFID